MPGKLHVFGLTGGIASGKSSVGEHFRKRGVPVLDADQLARQVVLPGSEGLAAITQQFGPLVLTEGRLDRPALGRIVFAAPAALQQLNAIMHPRIARLRQTRERQWQAQGIPLSCYELPLLFENGLQSQLRPVVLVSLQPEEQLRRACLRDSVSAATIEKRIAAQMSLSEKEPLAQFVIDNNGSLDSTRNQVDKVLPEIYRFFKIEPPQ